MITLLAVPDHLTHFSRSYHYADPTKAKFNICEPCLSISAVRPQDEIREMSALGVCSYCSNLRAVYDLALMSLYRAFELSNDMILDGGLPTHRQAFPYRDVIPEVKVLKMIDRVITNRSRDEGAD